MYIYWISIEGTISANIIKGYSLAIQPIFSKMWKFLILLICLLFHLKILFYDFLWQSAQEFQWKSQTLNKNEWFSIIFCVFMKTVGFWTAFFADMNSACKNTLVSVYFRLILSKAIALRLSRFSQKCENI